MNATRSGSPVAARGAGRGAARGAARHHAVVPASPRGHRSVETLEVVA